MYCGKCGTSNPDSNNYCMKCGSELAPSTRHPHTQQSQVADTRSDVPPTTSVGLYASFWRRIAAYLIDYLVLGISAAVVARWMASLGSASVDAGAIVVIVVFVGPWLYSSLFESSGKQGTVERLRWASRSQISAEIASVLLTRLADTWPKYFRH